jgi:hypothetical protein
MPAVNDVGEPCAGEPHARFDGRELETEHIPVTATAVGHPDGKPQELEGCRAYRQKCHRASSRPYRKGLTTVRGAPSGPESPRPSWT